MSIINSQPLIGASGQGGYFLTKSLRFRSSASAYLSRTPASAGNRQIFTWSGWVKRGELSNEDMIFSCYPTNGDNNQLRFSNDNKIGIYLEDGVTGLLVTTQVFRDVSAWYHIILAVDTTQATSSNRIKLYVNGSQVTAFDTATYPSQNYNTGFNNTILHTIAESARLSGRNFDGYMAEINFIDGQALTPSSFGETSTSTGVWIPKKYTGTYGTNGFYLPFTDVATTSGSNAGLGKDFSGNGNYWTTNNISVTSGSTYDSMKDVPTLTDTDTANYWTLNPLNTGQLGTVQSGNLEWIGGDQNNFRTVAAQILPTTGKFYWEVTPIGGGSSGAFVSGIYIGIMNYANGGTGLFASGVRIADTGRDDYVYYSDGRKVNSNSFVSYGNSYAANDVIGIAVDIDNGKIWYSKNGTWQASGDPAAGTNAAYTTVPFSTKTYAPAMSAAEITNAQKFNFGQRPFAYTPPTGFKALNTFNLPTPTIGATASTQANKYMDATLYTGNGSTLSVTNAGGFQPDLVWAKVRNAAFSHQIYDAVRGATFRLASDLTSAEGTVSTGLTAFNSNGFSLGSDGAINGNGNTFVAWNWKANGSGSTNTAGSITSTVSANTTAGFSIVTWTGNGSNSDQTLGTGLSTPLDFIITKPRGANVGSDSWLVYTSAITLNQNECLVLNSTSGKITGADQGTPSRGSTAGQLKLYAGTLAGSNNRNLNSNGVNYVAYCFAQVAGYSAFGSYTGNGSSDGAFVFTGFRPKYLIVKRTDSTGGWSIKDTLRDPYNSAANELNANLSDAEYANTFPLDIVSNGFKIRSSSLGINANGGTYIYMAFAESPFKYSLAR